MPEFDIADVFDRWPGTHTRGERSHLGQNLLGIIWPESLLPCMSDISNADVGPAIATIPALRDSGIVVATGFGSALEGLCVELLLEGQQPVAVCFSKAIECYELPLHWSKAIDAGQLLIIAPFPISVRRRTKAGVRSRNGFIATIASAVYMPYASPGSHEEVIAREVVASHKPLFTLENGGQGLLEFGAQRFDIDEIRRSTIDVA